ncbi:MAG: zf-HC2 domain-containing protein [Gemmatimonadales bacterium]
MSLEDRSVSELHATDRLPEYVRGGLSDGERAAVEAHLSTCAVCEEEVQILEALLAAPEPRLTPSEEARLYTPLTSSHPTVWRAGAWRAAAGIAVVLASYAVWLVSRTEGEIDGTWSADEALAGWETDLAELHPGEGELREALGGGGGPAWLELEGEELNDLDGLEGPSEELEL